MNKQFIKVQEIKDASTKFAKKLLIVRMIFSVHQKGLLMTLKKAVSPKQL